MAFGCKTPYIDNFNQCSYLPFPTSGHPTCCPHIFLDAVRAWLSLCFPAFNLTVWPLKLQPLIFLIAKFPGSLLVQLVTVSLLIVL